uniref:Uncharacterized protein n=1 Tax=Rhizophora mucronata TaxID=61149 RepID=A0A2P2Q5L2_RHIMU
MTWKAPLAPYPVKYQNEKLASKALIML